MTPDGDVWWEGMTERQARQVDRLAASSVDAGERPQGGASERALYHAGEAVPGDRARVGRSQGRAD